MSTDREWERWGQQDPYFGVITDPRFRRDRLTPSDLDHFFATGRVHVDYTLSVIRRHLDATFSPRAVLDFGCGVGRLLLPFAKMADRVVGIDVSSAMLAEAQLNLDAEDCANVELLHQGDSAGLEPSTFDLVHSSIVLQHIEVDRGLKIFGQLVALVAPRGIGAIQVTYGKATHAETYGVPLPPPPPQRTRRALLTRRVATDAQTVNTDSGADPVMLMNPYPLTALFFQIQRAQVHSVYVDFTDHGGELGVFLFFQKP